MTENFTLDHLIAALRAAAQGSYGAEAAVELLIAHRTWLRRPDFLDALVEYANDTGGLTPTHAWITWENVPAFLWRAGCSGGEARVLRLACELANVDTGIPLAELLSLFDNTNAGRVLDAIAHLLYQGGPR